MRIPTLLRRLIGVNGLVVFSFPFDPQGLLIDVRPCWRCPRRVDCGRCGVRTEKVPWAAPGSRFTRDFEEMAVYLAQVTDRTQVTRMLGIAWRTVGTIVERVVGERLDPTRLKELGEEGRAALEIATIDMSGGYQKALAEHVPGTKVVFDRFHVQRLASDALNEVRREQLRGTPEDKELFPSRFASWKNPWNLSTKEKKKLSATERGNKPLYRAHLLKESLASALEYKQPKRAREALRDWLSWASRSRLAPFVKTARTIREHFEGIVAYVEERVTNGVVEGMNTRLRMIARRAHGFHGPDALIAMLYLCCGGIQLTPRLP